MPGTAIVSAQVSLELRESLAREAAATDRSISAVVRRALREHLASPAPDAVGARLGPRPVASLKRSDVEALAASLAAKGLAQGSIVQVIGLLRQILGALVRDDELSRNVAEGIGRHGRKRARAQPPSDAQLSEMLAALRPRERPVVEFAAASGLRRGEV